jgi:hypothetical protein
LGIYFPNVPTVALQNYTNVILSEHAVSQVEVLAKLFLLGAPHLPA